MTTAADVVVDALVRHGVRHLFGMPGSHSTTLYDALKRNGAIATILIRNEQAGTFAADGYARVLGRPGVICTTAGPGATNALTGVAATDERLRGLVSWPSTLRDADDDAAQRVATLLRQGSAPVWLAAARWPPAVAPPFTTTTGIRSATVRRRSANDRPSPTLST